MQSITRKAWFVLVASLCAFACSGQPAANACQQGNSSGNTGQNTCNSVGGATGGGSSDVGGAPTSGGTLSTGGDTAAAGAETTGGTNSSTANGGATSGGNSNDRGSTATGGFTMTGGTTGVQLATGGALATGGTHVGPPYGFPQNNRVTRCDYPVAADSADAASTYAQWKADLVVNDGAGGYQRVRRPDNENGTTDNTVSEGIGYGMLLAVVMDDQSLFDNLFKYSQIHLDANGLMIWLIEASGVPGVEDASTNPPRRASGSATDADEDMAFALALAAQKWGGQGSLGATYRSLAITQIGRIWTYEVDHSGINMINAGDSWGKTFAWNPSYFAPNEYRLFAKLDSTHATGWTAIIDKGYQVLATSQNASTGLFPAWANSSGAATPAFSGAPTNYQYDAARVPFRIGWDYCDNGEARAKNILAKTSAFFAGIGAANIVDGYSLAGAATPENTSPSGVQSALFVGAAAVGAMGQSMYQSFIADAYTRLVTQPASMMLPKSYYFNLCWKTFSLLMLTGNLFDYSLYP